MKPIACCVLVAIAAHPAGPVGAQDRLLSPADVAYVDAMEFAEFLRNHAIEVRSVHRSRMEAFFPETGKAAFFRTDLGVVEVVFFPEPHDAEEIRITYSRTPFDVVPHRYTVEGTTGDVPIEAAYAMYFTLHRRWFIKTAEAEFDAALKRALGQDRRPRS